MTSGERVRRRRRTREDVTERICDAARELFAQRGYHGATTREIARMADVSETLLFRYYGNKNALFEEVVSQPFNRVMQNFIDQRETSTDRQADERYVFEAVYELFEKNRGLFTALLSSKGVHGDDGGIPSFDGMLPFFAAATREQLQKHTDLGLTPGFDMSVSLRLAFGMAAASVLLRDWLFPDGIPPRDQIVSGLEDMVNRALGPRPRD